MDNLQKLNFCKNGYEFIITLLENELIIKALHLTKFTYWKTKLIGNSRNDIQMLFELFRDFAHQFKYSYPKDSSGKLIINIEFSKTYIQIPDLIKQITLNYEAIDLEYKRDKMDEEIKDKLNKFKNDINKFKNDISTQNKNYKDQNCVCVSMIIIIIGLIMGVYFQSQIGQLIKHKDIEFILNNTAKITRLNSKITTLEETNKNMTLNTITILFNVWYLSIENIQNRHAWKWHKADLEKKYLLCQDKLIEIKDLGHDLLVSRNITKFKNTLDDFSKTVCSNYEDRSRYILNQINDLGEMIK